MTSRWPGRIVLAVLVLAAAGVGYWLMRPQPVLVDLAVVDRGPVEVTVDEEGETQVKEVYEVSAPTSGKLERLTLHAGDRVAKGERIARVRPADPPMRDARTRRELAAATRAAEAAVSLAEAEVNQARVALELARSDLDRSQRLASTRTISERALEQARLDVDTKQAMVQQAEANLELRNSQLDAARAAELQPGGLAGAVAEDQCCMAVVSPADGVVLKVINENEQVVQAGTTILEVGDPRDLEIVVDILSSDAVSITPGTAARIEEWGGPGVLTAEVRRVDPAGFTKVSALGIEEQRVNVTLDFTGPPEQRRHLGHAFRVLVRLVAAREDDAVRVPLGALFRADGGWAVYVVRDDRARLQPVETGHISSSFASIGQGLSVGDQVIVYPSDRISDGVEVRRRQEG